MATLIEASVKAGLSGAFGFVVGIAAFIWIYPQTSGGTKLVVSVCFAACIILGQLIYWLFGRSNTQPATPPPADPPQDH